MIFLLWIVSFPLISVSLPFLFMFACPCVFSFAMITYGWCEQSRIQMKIPLFWAGVDVLPRGSAVVFGFDAVEFWNVQFILFLVPTLAMSVFMWFLDDCTSCIYKILYDSYILLSVLLDHNIMFDLVVWKLLNRMLQYIFNFFSKELLVLCWIM